MFLKYIFKPVAILFSGANPYLPRVCLQFVIVVFPDHTHLLVLIDLIAWNFYVNLCYILTSGSRRERVDGRRRPTKDLSQKLTLSPRLR